MLIIECINKKEFQTNRAKLNEIGLYKLSPHHTKPLLYTITRSFLIFVPFPCTRVPRTDRQAATSYYFHSNVYFLTVDMPQCYGNDTQVPAGNSHSGTRVQNLYLSQPYLCCEPLAGELKQHRKNASEPPHEETNKMSFAPSEDSDQPGHPPSLIRVFTVRSMGS